MKKKIVVLTLSAVCILLFCIRVKDNNPLLPDYQGDYRLTIKTTGLPDSLVAFRRYTVACSTGADTFSTYRISGAAAGAISLDAVRFGRMDSIFFHCIDAFDGYARIDGVCPNGKTVGDSAHVLIINPYYVLGDSVAVVNETSQYRIGGPVSDTSLVKLSVIWTSEAIRDSTGPDSFFAVTPGSTQRGYTVSAVLEDESGHSLALRPDSVRVILSVRPVLSVATMDAQPVLGKPLIVSVILSNADTSLYRLYAVNGQWRDSSSSKHIGTRDTISLGRVVTDTGPQTYSIYVVNSSGLKSNEIKIADTVHYSLPVISFTAESLLVSLNDTFPVTVSCAPAAEKYVWRVDLLKADTTATPNYRVLLTDSLYHTLMVYGIDRYGYAGKTAPVILYARPFEYVIQPVAFPLDVKARSWTQWTAGVNNAARAAQKDAKYSWTVVPQNYDSIKYGGAANDTMLLYWKDSAHAIITVTASDTAAGGSAPYAKSVSVRRYAPDLFFKAHSINASTTDDIVLAVSAADSNAGGSIDSIFWRRGGKGAAPYASRDSVWIIRSPVPDSFWVSAYARDNDGFFSAQDSEVVFVKAFRPYIEPPMADTTVFINTPDTFRVTAHVSDSTAAIAKYFWDFDGNGTWDDSVASSRETHTFTIAGAVRVIVKCRDTKGVESASDTFKVTVSNGGPVVSGMSPDTCWIKDSVTLTINAREINPAGSIVSYGIAWDGGAAFTVSVSASVKNVFMTSGMKPVRLYALDNNGMSSDTVTDSVFVRLGAPAVTAFTHDSPTVYIKDNVRYTISAADTNGTVQSYSVSWNSGEPFTQYANNVIDTAFMTAGTRSVKAFVVDNDGISSDTQTYSLPVVTATPAVNSITVLDTPETRIFVNESLKYKIVASSPHGMVTGIYISYSGGSTPDDSSAKTGAAVTDTFTHQFPLSASGSHTINAWAVNDEDIVSTTVLKQITVRLARPVVTGIITDTAVTKIFINDPVRFTVSALDTNGTADSISVDNGAGAFGPWQKAAGSAYLFVKTFLKTDAGAKTVRARAKDNDGLISDTFPLPLTIRLGAPVVDSVTIDTSANDIFVRDNRTYTVFAHDTNGVIRKIYASWNNGASLTDSVIAAGGTGQFTHAYDTSLSGPRIARFWVRDDDTIMSSSKDTTITVRLAPPVLWGDNPTKDTVWTIINNGYGMNYNVHINSYDTNGTIGRYYWSEAGSFDSTTATKTNDSLYSRLIGINDVNHAFPIWIYGRDNDGLVRGRQFVAFADSAPPAPIVTADKPTGQIRIGWIGKDVKDGNGTMFKILLKQGSAPSSSDILIDFTSGTSLSPGQNGYDFSYTFIPSGGNGTYYYQVIAKDARGSISYNSASFFNFP